MDSPRDGKEMTPAKTGDKGGEENSPRSGGGDYLPMRRGGPPTGPGGLMGATCQAKGSWRGSAGVAGAIGPVMTPQGRAMRDAVTPTSEGGIPRTVLMGTMAESR